MSNVYKRKRTQSPLEVISKSKELLRDVYALIMNEKKIPKKHRYFVGKSLYDSANKIVCYIFNANNIYPRSKEDYAKRKAYQECAQYECALLLNLLDTYSDMLPNLSYKDIERLAINANSIKALIAAWIRANDEQFDKLQ